jgi:hypothetical protein
LDSSREGTRQNLSKRTQEQVVPSTKKSLLLSEVLSSIKRIITSRLPPITLQTSISHSAPIPASSAKLINFSQATKATRRYRQLFTPEGAIILPISILQCPSSSATLWARTRSIKKIKKLRDPQVSPLNLPIRRTLPQSSSLFNITQLPTPQLKFTSIWHRKTTALWTLM